MFRKIAWVINLALIAAMALSGRAAAGKKEDVTTIQFSNQNRDFVIRYAHEQKISVLDAYKLLFESAAASAAAEHSEVGFSAVGAVYAMRSKCRTEGITASESWRQVIATLKTKGLINGGILKDIESSSGGDSGSGSGGGSGSGSSDSDCGCPCEVFYKGSCGSSDCQLCQACCDTKCDTKCASSTGCSDCQAKKVEPF